MSVIVAEPNPAYFTLGPEVEDLQIAIKFLIEAITKSPDLAIFATRAPELKRAILRLLIELGLRAVDADPSRKAAQFVQRAVAYYALAEKVEALAAEDYTIQIDLSLYSGLVATLEELRADGWVTVHSNGEAAGGGWVQVNLDALVDFGPQEGSKASPADSSAGSAAAPAPTEPPTGEAVGAAGDAPPPPARSASPAAASPRAETPTSSAGGAPTPLLPAVSPALAKRMTLDAPSVAPPATTAAQPQPAAQPFRFVSDTVVQQPAAAQTQPAAVAPPGRGSKQAAAQQAAQPAAFGAAFRNAPSGQFVMREGPVLPAAPVPGALEVLSTSALALAAVDHLRRMQRVALSCACPPPAPGGAPHAGALFAVYVHGDGRTFMFDLHAMRAKQAELAATVEALRALLQDAAVVKVMYDGRRACEVLYYRHGLRVTPVWDCQVAHGVAQVMQGLGHADAALQAVTLNSLLIAHGLPAVANAAVIHGRWQKNPSLWAARPLSAQLQAYVVACLAPLLELRTKISRHTGSAGTAAALRLSCPYSELLFAAKDRSYAAAAGSYAAAAKLPVGVDLELSVSAADGYKARFELAVPEVEGEGASGSAGGAPAQQDPRSDPDVAIMLELFPKSIRREILQHCCPGDARPQPESPPAPATAAASLNGDEGAAPRDSEGSAQGSPSASASDERETVAAEPEVQTPGSSRVPARAASGSKISAPLDNSSDSDSGSSVCNDSTSAALGQESAAHEVTPGSGPPAASADSNASPLVFRWPQEIVVDEGRPVAVLFSDGKVEELRAGLRVTQALQLLAEGAARLHSSNTGAADAAADGDEPPPAATALDPVHLFQGDNRAGLPGSLHRISAMRGRGKEVLGLTYRVGRHVPGASTLIQDILATLSVAGAAGEGGTPSLLLLGVPGVGKTTLLRDVARMLADTFRRRVVVIDTSNEIAGDGVVPHSCIGRARRMMVPSPEQQALIMGEAVKNHNPQVVVIDEISTSREAAASKIIAEKGVALVGTAHGISLSQVLKNPELNPLVGGVHQVIIGDEAARKAHSKTKTRTERKGAPTFHTLIEVIGHSKWRVHMNVAASVDALLAGEVPCTQLRWVAPNGRMMARMEGPPPKAPVGGAAAGLLREAPGGGGWLAELAAMAALY